MKEVLIPLLMERFGARMDETARDLSLVVEASQLHSVVAFLRGEWAFDMLVDVVGVDYLGMAEHTGPRFGVLYNLKSMSHGSRRLLLVHGPRRGDLL